MQRSSSTSGASPTLRSALFTETKLMRCAHQAALLLSLLLMACLLCGGMATAAATETTAPAITLNPTVGPPTTKILVSGSGFDPNARVYIYFDSKNLASAMTNGSGIFAGAPLTVPASAIPGTHSVIAGEGAKKAQKSFLVRTDWAQFQFSPDHKGLNPYENVLEPGDGGAP